MKQLVAIILACSGLMVADADDERIFLDASINGRPVRFIFDTGAGVPFILFSTAAQKLGLKVTPPPADNQLGPGQVAAGLTELCDLQIARTNLAARFSVVNIPGFLKWDAVGVLGWPAVSNNLFSVDFASHTFSFLTNLPATSAGWVKLRISTNVDLLGLELAVRHGRKDILLLDSGSANGMALNAKAWQDWKSAHARQPVTLDAYYTPNMGLVIKEESWAEKISLGSLTLTKVPVMEAGSGEVALATSLQTTFAATLGFAALKRLDVIFDGRRGLAYLRPKSAPPMPYEHDRLGAVFVPENLSSDDLVARVVVGSPAYRAGIRNADVLLKIGGLDTTRWRTDPQVLPLSRFWNGPAGTRLVLTLKRGETTFPSTVTLQNILPPDDSKN